jgi:phenylalanyl-tRNA synthetase alpha subunit
VKVAVSITKTHNPFDEDYRASCLRENLTSSSYGEGLETGRESAQEPRQSFTRQQVFRDMKSVLDTRPIFHQLDETIRGHVFCSFLALVIRKELDRRLEKAGHCFEWADIKQDLKALQEITIEDRGKMLAIRSECLGTCGKIFQAVGVAVPSTIREVA